MTNIRPDESKAIAVGRGISANLINEKPGWISAPSNSTTDAGIVGRDVGVSVNKLGKTGVSVATGSIGVMVGVKEIGKSCAG